MSRMVVMKANWLGIPQWRQILVLKNNMFQGFLYIYITAANDKCQVAMQTQTRELVYRLQW